MMSVVCPVLVKPQLPAVVGSKQRKIHLRYSSSKYFLFVAPIQWRKQESPASDHADTKASGSTNPNRSSITAYLFSWNTNSVFENIPFFFNASGILLQISSLKASVTFFGDANSLAVAAAWATIELGITFDRSSFFVTWFLIASEKLRTKGEKFKT